MLNDADIRIDSTQFGFERSPLRVTHLPSGLVLNQRDGESRAQLLARLETAVAAQPEKG